MTEKPKNSKKKRDSGIITAIGSVPPGTILNEKSLAEAFSRSTMSIKRAVERKEIPPPIKVLGELRWTAGSILSYLERRIEEKRQEQASENKRLSAYLE